MRVALTDEQEFLREAVAGVLAREATPAAVRGWADSHDTAPAETLAERQGWTGIGLDEELGGQGGGVVELAVMAEELGRAVVPWDRLLGGCLALQLLGAAVQDGIPRGSASNGAPGVAAAELAAATAAGERTAVLCVDGRHPPRAWPESIVSDQGLTLSADFVAGAAAATELLIPVCSGEAVRLMTVDAGDSEVTVTPRPLVDHTRSLAAVQLRGASARDLGPIDEATVARAGAAAAVLVSADALGAASRMLEMTIEYVSDRRQFGVPVGSFQAVKHAAAEMLVDVEASRSAVRYASWAVDAGGQDGVTWGSIAKAHTCGAALRVADKALFLHGAIGYTWEHELQFQFKRAKSDAWLFGSPDAHRDAVANGLALVSGPPAALSIQR